LGTRLPTTTEEAQFNVAWPVAAMLIDGEVGPEQTMEKRLDDPQMRALARKVEVVETEELNELCRLRELGDPAGKFAGVVTITLKDGCELNSGLVGDPAFPPANWDEARMAEKFRWIAGFVLDEARIDALLDTLWRFEELPSVRTLAQELNEN
jgi:2-methylcitrate dehydratase PrpD